MDKLTNKTIIRTVSDDQHQIIKWIMELYCPNGFDLDPTYSKGNFYKSGIPQPKIKLDILKDSKADIVADVEHVPLKPLSVRSVVFDPPFVGAVPTGKGKDGIIRKRFGFYPYIPKLWDMYRNALVQLYLVMKPQGVLVFKCQDSVEHNKQYISHLYIANVALSLGFYPKDLFVLTASTRLIGAKHHKQQHARKFHSYFWVFIKKKSPVSYSLTNPK